jgi:hypothetical protein
MAAAKLSRLSRAKKGDTHLFRPLSTGKIVRDWPEAKKLSVPFFRTVRDSAGIETCCYLMLSIR